MTDYKALVRALIDGGVEFILVGGMAAAVHGASRLTLDVDVLYRRSADNLRRLVAALAPHHPYLRGAPPGLPFRWDVATVERGLNFTLTTNVGDLDILGEIVGGDYEALRDGTVTIQLYGVECRCLDIKKKLEQIVKQEREGIKQKLPEGRERSRHEQKLGELPPDPAGQIRDLQKYDFVDPEAKRQFDELLDSLRQQMMQPFMQGMKQ